jgi:MFS transporter, SP family, ERD6-like sugar transporter
MYYGPSIMIAAGIHIGNSNPKLSGILLNIPLSVTNAIGTLISIFLIDKLGRRYTMLRSLPFMMIGWLAVAAGMFMLSEGTQHKSLSGNLAFIGTLLFLLCFGIGMSSTPWTVCSEVFPLHVIGTANSLTTTTNWLSNFVVAWFFPLMLN